MKLFSQLNSNLMKNLKFTLLIIFAGALGASAVVACDLCAVYAATEAKGESGKGFFAGVAEQFSHFGTVQVEGQKVSNPAGQFLDSSISQLFVGYNFNERTGVQFNAPMIYRSFKRPEGFAIDRGTESGMGDVSLIGNFLPWRHDKMNFTFMWRVLGGIKFPTGDTSRIKEEFSEMEIPGAPVSGIHGHDLTLGTGSIDGIVGTGIYTRWKRGFLGANVQYTIRSKGDFDYRFANDLTWSGGPGVYLFLEDDFTLALQAVVSGEHKGLDTFRGGPADDTGVTAVYLGPQISLTWKGHLSAELGLDLPMTINNTALQTVPDYRVRGGLTWHF